MLWQSTEAYYFHIHNATVALRLLNSKNLSSYDKYQALLLDRSYSKENSPRLQYMWSTSTQSSTREQYAEDVEHYE